MFFTGLASCLILNDLLDWLEEGVELGVILSSYYGLLS